MQPLYSRYAPSPPPSLPLSPRCISLGRYRTVPRAVLPTGSQTTTVTRPATTPCVTGTGATVREPLAMAGREERLTLSSPGVRVGRGRERGRCRTSHETSHLRPCVLPLYHTPIMCPHHHIITHHTSHITLVSCHISPSHLSSSNFCFAEHRTIDNCNSGCLNNWLGDRYCDQV